MAARAGVLFDAVAWRVTGVASELDLVVTVRGLTRQQVGALLLLEGCVREAGERQGRHGIDRQQRSATSFDHDASEVVDGEDVQPDQQRQRPQQDDMQLTERGPEGARALGPHRGATGLECGRDTGQ